MNNLKMKNKLVTIGVVCLMAALSLPFLIPLYLQTFCKLESVFMCGLGEPQFYGTIMFVILLALGTVLVFFANRSVIKNQLSKKNQKK